MSHISEDVIALIREAIQLEINGRSFFEYAADKTQNELGKKMFSKLAQDELGHLKAFGELFTTMLGTSEWKKFVDEEELQKSTVLEELISRMEQQKRSASDLEALRIGMELERKAIAFFEKSAQETSDGQALKIFKQICEEEKTHHDLLQAQYDGVTNSGFWFDIAGTRWMANIRTVALPTASNQSKEINMEKLLLVREWIFEAEHDETMAKDLLELRPELTLLICFHSLQAIEKYLRAFCVERGLHFTRDDTVSDLLELVVPGLPVDQDLYQRRTSLKVYAPQNDQLENLAEPTFEAAQTALNTVLQLKNILDKVLSNRE